MKRMTTCLLLLSVLCATPVLAFERRFPASMCTTGSDDRGEMDHDAVSYGLRNRSDGTQWRRIKFRCPVTVDEMIPLNRIKRFNVDIVDNHTSGSDGQVTARACITFRYASGGVCAGNYAYSGFGGWETGWRELQVPYLGPDGRINTVFKPWLDYPIDYPYIEVTLPGNGALGFSAILGYTVSDIP